MAKTISLITTGLQGTLGDITYVKSKRYGKHARTKRGTYKPATLNKKMKESSSRLSFANAPAKLIFDALRHDHKDGSLWSRLLSIYRKQVKDGVAPDIQCLAKLECNHDFKLDVLLSDYKLQTVVDNNMLQVDVQYYRSFCRYGKTATGKSCNARTGEQYERRPGTTAF